METREIKIYIGLWDSREFVYSLSEGQTKSLVETHFAFGDPAIDEYALGKVWASGDEPQGWRIIETKVTVPVIAVEIEHSDGAGAAHAIWQCPYCKKYYSDDWQCHDYLPVLLRCGCVNGSNYLLGDSFVRQKDGWHL